MDWTIWLLFAVVGAAFVTDMKARIIPNMLTVSGMLTGLIYHTLADGWIGIAYSAVGLAAGFGIMLVLYLLGGIGGGDVKLFAAIGAICGTEWTLHCMMYSIIYAGFAGIGWIVLRKQFWGRIIRVFGFFANLAVFRQVQWFTPGERAEMLRFPFMIAVAPAAVTTVWMLHG
ncbi:A24 family peptidase [Paenibacillus sp. y28]|uniref:A24 family peptidase n=1 Tax=Paenibacillus sp. y28 TaxID=3129110 RepID=UPI003019567B